MKGIILAGGKGTRLNPMTNLICKQLLPIYDKPMVYYPLSVLMLAGIRDILIISTPKDLDKFKELFKDGSHLGLNFTYKQQEKPKGIADAFIVGEDFIGKDNSCLVLGDNVFYGHGLTDLLNEARKKEEGAIIFGYHVKDPKRYGVIEFDKNMKVLSIEEKPKKPKSNYAVVGLYFYDNNVINIAKSLNPSKRGEIEITDINKAYLKENKLEARLMRRGFAWFDTGTTDSISEAADFVRSIQNRQSLMVACVEEIAYRKGYINKEKLLEITKKFGKSTYGDYLKNLVNEI